LKKKSKKDQAKYEKHYTKIIKNAKIQLDNLYFIIYQCKKKAKEEIAYHRSHTYLLTLDSKKYQIKNEIQYKIPVILT